MPIMTLCEGDNFTLDADYELDEGKITTDHVEFDTAYVEINSISIEFQGAGIVDITKCINEKQREIIKQQIIYWHYH